MIASFYLVDINSEESYLFHFHIIWHSMQHYIKLVFTVFEMLLCYRNTGQRYCAQVIGSCIIFLAKCIYSSWKLLLVLCPIQAHFSRAEVCWLCKQRTTFSPSIVILTVGAGRKSPTADRCEAFALLMAEKSEIKILTDRIRSPLLSSPLKSAGPPARMKETKMPSPSSPPTMLKPRPVEPLCSNTFLGSLPKTATVSGWRTGQGLWERWAEMLPKLKETAYKHSWVSNEEPVNGTRWSNMKHFTP